MLLENKRNDRIFNSHFHLFCAQMFFRFIKDFAGVLTSMRVKVVFYHSNWKLNKLTMKRPSIQLLGIFIELLMDGFIQSFPVSGSRVRKNALDGIAL